MQNAQSEDPKADIQEELVFFDHRLGTTNNIRDSWKLAPKQNLDGPAPGRRLQPGYTGGHSRPEGLPLGKKRIASTKKGSAGHCVVHCLAHDP